MTGVWQRLLKPKWSGFASRSWIKALRNFTRNERKIARDCAGDHHAGTGPQEQRQTSRQ
jgi:hypothetical protein